MGSYWVTIFHFLQIATFLLLRIINTYYFYKNFAKFPLCDKVVLEVLISADFNSRYNENTQDDQNTTWLSSKLWSDEPYRSYIIIVRDYVLISLYNQLKK